MEQQCSLAFVLDGFDDDDGGDGNDAQPWCLPFVVVAEAVVAAAVVEHCTNATMDGYVDPNPHCALDFLSLAGCPDRHEE